MLVSLKLGPSFYQVNKALLVQPNGIPQIKFDDFKF